MKVNIETSKELEALHEMFIKVEDALPADLENSIFYSRIKNSMTRELLKFMREQTGLRADLMRLKDKIGEVMSEAQIHRELDAMMKYNEQDNNVGVIYHIESTRIDYGVPVIVIIKREVLHVKKFVFRFKKEDMSANIGGVGR
jgi:hypothetical protein